MAELPSGTVTFLFTDVEGSTRLWEEHPDAMHDVMARHDEIVRGAIESHGGHVVKTTGDGFHAAFATARDAIDAALAAEQALTNEPPTQNVVVKVRMGVHTGEARVRDGDYYGSALNRAARLMAVGHGGQIVCSQATADLARDALAEGVVLVDLGEHRLRDLSRPERLFQVNAPGLSGTFAPLRSLDAFPSNLPAQLSSFVGRELDVADIAQVLREKRLVTLTGVGGVGKTRLALQVAAEVLPRFRDGAWLCELAAVRDPAGVVDAVANVFQVTARPGLGLDESLVAYLGDQELLMMLDNCEHVLRPVAALVRAIEAACPRVRVLATSREGLGVRGEQNLTVPSLDVPDDLTDLEAVTASEAVRLFVDRAQGAKANFVLDATNADGVAQVCRRLDGVPLAIELAAARITTMNPSELARRLDRRFRLLTGGDRDAIERHQTLRATIDWSYDLLTGEERRLLDRLSVFAGGCALDAAEAVCEGDPIDADDVYELLANLVARSLVVVDDTGPDTRYRLLETIRQYGEERLAEAGDTDTLRARHCDHYTEFAGLVDSYSYGAEQVEWGARLARDHDNLIAAMAFAVDAQDVERALRLLSQLPFEGHQVNDVVIFDPEPVLALPGAGDDPGFAIALMRAGVQAWRRGDGPRAVELCEEALAAEHRLGPTPDAHLALWASSLRGLVALDAGAQRESADHFLDASRYAGADGIPGIAALSLGGAAAALAFVDRRAAVPLATEGAALARQSGMPHAISYTLLCLAQTLAPDDPDRARDLLDESLQLTAALGYENPSQLDAAVVTAAIVGTWPTVLHTASRSLHHQLRSAGTSRLVLGGILNFAARALAAGRPEPAAVIQGAVGALLRGFTADVVDPAIPAESNTYTTFAAAARHETTQLIVTALGEPRMRELRAEGAAMNEDQVCTYARRHIDEYLAASRSE
jgi:predicted ATPase/class 3 adenylate cyclase